MNWRVGYVGRCVALALSLAVGLSGCSTRHLIANSLANEMAQQGQAPEDDPELAREASAFYLKLSESILREVPDNAALAQAVATGFTQYAYAFVSFDADRIDNRDSKAAQRLRERAARLYRRARDHALTALERQHPGLKQALEGAGHAPLALRKEQVGLAYWAAASWGGLISLSKDNPDVVADLPLAMRLAQAAYAVQPDYGNGALAGLMANFELARPGGSVPQATVYFDQAIALGGDTSAAPRVAKAEGICVPAGDRAGFDALLRQAQAIATVHPDLSNSVMRERATWLLETADDLF